MFLRRLRGIASTALLWGAAWALIAGLVAAASAMILGAHLGPFLAFRQGAGTGLSWGLAAGALFGCALMLAEQRRGFAGLGLGRAALWGAVAGVWFPVLMRVAFGPSAHSMVVVGLPALLVTGSMGAVSGMAMLWIARRDSGQGQSLTGSDGGDAGALPAPAPWRP